MESKGVIGVMFGDPGAMSRAELDAWAASLDELELMGGVTIGMVLGKALQSAIGDEDPRVQHVLLLGLGTLPHALAIRGQKLPEPRVIQQSLETWLELVSDESSIISTSSSSADLDRMLSVVNEAKSRGARIHDEDAYALLRVSNVVAGVLSSRGYLSNPGNVSA